MLYNISKADSAMQCIAMPGCKSNNNPFSQLSRALNLESCETSILSSPLIQIDVTAVCIPGVMVAVIVSTRPPAVLAGPGLAGGRAAGQVVERLGRADPSPGPDHPPPGLQYSGAVER